MPVQMSLKAILYRGPELDPAAALLDRLPTALVTLLDQINGFVQFQGGLHVRGVCPTPLWHSLEQIMSGDYALYRLFPAVRPCDVPFGQDCRGNQFVLREGTVWRLSVATVEMHSLGMGLTAFIAAVQDDPVAYLSLDALLEYLADHSLALNFGEVLVPEAEPLSGRARLAPRPVYEALLAQSGGVGGGRESVRA